MEERLNEEIEKASKYLENGDSTMFETEAQYEAYIEGLMFALNLIKNNPQ